MVRSVRPWSLARLADTGFLSNFDLSPDGRLVALIRRKIRRPAIGESRDVHAQFPQKSAAGLVFREKTRARSGSNKCERF